MTSIAQSILCKKNVLSSSKWKNFIGEEVQFDTVLENP
jgi:hypothetical protein